MNDTKSDMISGELYQPFSKELYNDRLYCKSLCHELNNLSPLKRDDINLIPVSYTHLTLPTIA